MLWVSIWAALLLVTIQGARFQRRVANEALELWSAKGAGQAAPRSFEGLPTPVRRHMEVSGAAGRAVVRSVRIRHGGTFRPGPDKAWSPIRGGQYFATDPPGFVWWGRTATVIRWHRDGFRRMWTRRSRDQRAGRPGLNREIVNLIRRMSQANVIWGAPRIRNELAKLGIELAVSLSRSNAPMPQAIVTDVAGRS